MNPTIRVVLDERQHRHFLTLPQRIGYADPVWRTRLVSQLVDPSRNPFLRHADLASFLAYDEDDRPIGRICAYVDHRSGVDSGAFGIFDCTDNQAAADALFDAAETWLKRRKCQRIIGPLDPTSFTLGGVMTEGFDQPKVIAIPHTPPYYQRLLDQAGFAPAVKLLAWRYGDQSIPKQVKLISDAVSQRDDLTIRPIDVGKGFESDLDVMTDLYNKAWKQNWNYAPIDREDLRWLLQDAGFIDEELSLIAEVDGAPVAMAVATPSFDELLIPSNSKSTEWLTNVAARVTAGTWVGQARMKLGNRPKFWRQMLYGVIPEYRGSALGGLGVHLYYLIRTRAQKLGYKFGETAWTNSEDQILNNGLKVLGAVQSKKFIVYER